MVPEPKESMATPPELTKLTKLLRTPLWDGDEMEGKALTSALLTVREGYSTFYEPLDQVAQMVLDVFTKKKALRAALREVAADWDDDTRDAFLLVAGYTTHWRTRWDHAYTGQKEAIVASTREMCDAVGLAKNATVKKKLSTWGLSNQKSPKLPKELPTTLDGALALYAELGLGKDALALGKPSTAEDGSPEPLADFHRRHASLGSRTIVTPKKLASATKSLRGWVKIALQDIEGEDVDRGTLHPTNLSKRAIAFGSTSGGDVYFLDPGLEIAAEHLPVFRFVHDEGHAEVEASSLGAFVAAQVLEAAFGDGPAADALERLLARDRKRVKVPATLAKAPPCDEDEDED
jgi:hypothetical protein